MTRVFSFQVDETIKEESLKKFEQGEIKAPKKLNITDAIRCFRSLARNVINKTVFDCVKQLSGFCESIKTGVTDIRDGRSFSYDRKNNKKRFYMSCKTSI